jgi:hypothetical protein
VLGVLALQWGALLQERAPVARIGLGSSPRQRARGGLLRAARAGRPWRLGRGPKAAAVPERQRARGPRALACHAAQGFAWTALALRARAARRAGRGRGGDDGRSTWTATPCPVRERCSAFRPGLGLPVRVVSNGSRPARPPGLPLVETVGVEAGADAADDWIAERIGRATCASPPTSRSPPAAWSAARGPLAQGPALDHGQHRRRAGRAGGGARPARGGRGHRRAGAAHRADRSRFLSALDAEVAAAGRDLAAPPPRPWVPFE